MISPSLSPNTDRADVLKAIEVLFAPQMWKEGNAQDEVHRWFRKYLGAGEIAFFNSGRSALLAILQAFGIGPGDEVLVQAFTCVAVPNSVLWAGAKPVYVDIDDSYNMDPKDAEKKITKKTKALIVQHTFGIPAQVDRLLALAKKHKLMVIEDCAHALGATYKGKRLGTLGDASFFSFGRDKVVSSVWGGMGYIKSQNSNLKSQKELKKYEQSLTYPSIFWIFQQLLHPIAFSLILPLYDVGVGKVLLVLLQKMKLLSFPVYTEEKSGRQPQEFPKRYPNALATLLKVQLNKLERYNKKRRDSARYYSNSLKKPIVPGASYLRYPILVEDPASVTQKAKKQGILLGNWYHDTIDPTGVEYEAIGYEVGSSPKAEEAANHILNLPTNVTEQEASIILSYV
ncbi:aminotransferase class I/II-fold pyridoxal phosphate-dependent enzyme [Candidatus Gottesmanbacteria bacterium]|nr:aminotransferase class I/II-fold pyridoxal phosphate-dependent enzyme [Candidatus Gottesmanbacteria bacterium]